MPSYIIVFELKRRRKSYTDLEERLAKFDTCWQVRDCVWIVVSNGTNDDSTLR